VIIMKMTMFFYKLFDMISDAPFLMGVAYLFTFVWFSWVMGTIYMIFGIILRNLWAALVEYVKKQDWR